MAGRPVDWPSAAESAWNARRTDLRANGAIGVQYCAPPQGFYCERHTMQSTIEQVAGLGGAIRTARPVQKQARQHRSADQEHTHD